MGSGMKRNLWLFSIVWIAVFVIGSSSAFAQEKPIIQPSAQEQNLAAAQADDAGRVNLIEENDYFASNDDRHYTQGAKASYLSGAIIPNDAWDTPYRLMSDSLPIFEGGDFKRKYDWTIVGQSIFTPIATSVVHPSPQSRPYGAWLYTGVGFLQSTKHETHDTLENAEILGGIVGPGAFGNVTQNDFHEFIGQTPSRGWQNQLHNEPGLVLIYERKWRFEQPLIGNFAVDAIPELGATGGNIFTYAETGGLIRLGQNLKADYGVDHIRPSLSGTGWFDKTEIATPLGWYLFAGVQGRAVARNIFLDGNSFVPSPHTDKRTLVGDFVGGLSLFWRDDIRVDFTYTERTKEFYGPDATQDKFGGIDLVFNF